MEEKQPHVSEYKKKTVDEFVKLIKEYPIIGVVNMENLPAPQLQGMRTQLRGKVILRMTKRRLMNIVIDKVKAEKKGIEKLIEHLKGMPALLFSKENPFKLYKILKKNKSSAPAKAGQTAPKDIMIPAGPTPFAPGPVIGELGIIGIKTSVEGGKIAIKEDTIVVKEGEEIKANVAGMLTRLGIKPMEVGLDLVAVYEDGTIYAKDILDIDEERFLAQLQDAHRWSFNLAIEAGYFTKDTVELLVPKAFNEAKALALEANIMADAVAEELVAKAEAQGKSLKQEIKYEEKIGKPEEKKEEASKEEPKPEEKEPEKVEAPKEEPKVEEKKEEVKEEPEPEKKEEKKPEETKAEEPKVEEKKEEVKEEPEPEKKPEETKAEEPKPEEKEPEKVEAPKEEETAKPEVEVPKEEPEKVEVPKEESKPEKVEAQEHEVEEVKPEEEEKKPEETKVEEPKQEVPEPEPKEEPNVEEKKEAKEEIKTRAKELKEKLEKARESKKKTEEVKEVKVEEKPHSSGIIRNVQKDRSEILEKKKQEIDDAENLFQQLQKKGTLRGIQKKEIKSEIPSGPLTPQQIIEKGVEKMKQKQEEENVPSAYELMQKKMSKKRI